jgi:hypothetical protein
LGFSDITSPITRERKKGKKERKKGRKEGRKKRKEERKYG